jgi:2-polyprenyl-3-methyl-5-hydroxy-6-metoxy-1,4-benzoquinol methylase
MPAKKQKTRESQYQRSLDLLRKDGLTSMGLMTNQAWHDDPKHLLFTLSRYKFVAKMLAGKSHVLEVGCADAFGTRIVLQAVRRLTAIDFDPVFVSDVRARMNPRWKFICEVHDMLSGPYLGRYDAAYALDVIEHIRPSSESRFLKNMTESLTTNGVLVLGTPSLESQAHAGPQSKEGHVNCKDEAMLRSSLTPLFHNVFVFSMNDEVVHTGFYPMAHYLFAVACGRKTA